MCVMPRDAASHSIQGQAARVAQALDETMEPAHILGQIPRFVAGRTTLGTAFGREGCALIHIIAENSISIDIFTLDTGLFFEETYELWEKLQSRYGVTIRGVRPSESVEEQSQRLGSSLWDRQPDRCCYLRKVLPLREELKNASVWVTGLRRAQSAVRGHATLVSYEDRHDVLKVNPLVAWSDDALDTFIREHDIPTNPLHARGFPSIGCWPCTTQVAEGENARAGRWRGQNRTECGIHAGFAKLEAIS